MASWGSQGVNRYLGLFKKVNRFDTGLGASLPEAYKKFWKEWKHMQPAAVHYVPEKGRWKKNEVTGEILPVQNVPLPLKFPKESNRGMWGGEAVVLGFQKRHKFNRRVAHFWFPQLQRSVVRSEVLNVYLSMVVTQRTLRLIHENYGFDHYVLKTPACDLRSELALKLKRKILKALLEKCPAYTNEPDKQKEIYEEYKKYLSSYTAEDVEWYGLTYNEAIIKIAEIQKKENAPKPLKHQYRAQLIADLKAANISEEGESKPSQMGGWISKINPFGKKHET